MRLKRHCSRLACHWLFHERVAGDEPDGNAFLLAQVLLDVGERLVIPVPLLRLESRMYRHLPPVVVPPNLRINNLEANSIASAPIQVFAHLACDGSLILTH